ncbi:MAG: zinc-binding alcohol dehydrogenase family protein [Acidimicrobiales bacterium]
MQEAVLESPGRLVLVERDEPPPPSRGEALVAVRRVGICGTDHHAYGGTQNFFRYPRVLGHELAVEVLAVGPGVTRVKSGDPCAVLPYISCGSCRACERGRTNCCAHIDVIGVTRDGGMRERMLLPAVNLFSDSSLTFDQLVLVETLGIGWHAVRRAEPRQDDQVLVLGAGPVGLAVAQAARGRSESLVIGDASPERVAFASESGFDALLVDAEFTTRLLDRRGGTLPSVVFDATGSRASMENAFELTGPCGTLVFVGHTTGSVTFQNPGFHARELDVRASRNATVGDLEHVIAAVRSGSLDALGWINHRTTLARIVEDLPRLAANPGRVVKTVVDIGQPLPEATT